MLDHTQNTATTADLELALRLKKMSHQTRRGTIASIRNLRRAVSSDGDLSVDTVRLIAKNPDPELRGLLGKRAAQVFSDARRALRTWDEAPIRTLALKLRGELVTCEHAIDAAHLNFPKERAKRAEAAIRAFAKYLNQSVDSIIATETVIAPDLIPLTPEDLGVGSIQTLKNKKTLILAAIRLVDPITLGRIKADTTRLNEDWQVTVDTLVARAPAHSPSVAAIFRRLAMMFHAEAKNPVDLVAEDLTYFIHVERQTHSKAFEGKLRMAMKIWNGLVQEGSFKSVMFDRSRTVPRLPDVAWRDVPAAIREPLDELLGQVSSADNSGGIWEDLVVDDLGVPEAEIDANLDSNELAINPATAELWRRSVKRVWHAAMCEESGLGKPETNDMLFTAHNARVFVTAVWQIRREKLEKAGKDWDTNKKGIYETGLLKMFVQAGRLLGVDEDQLEKISEFIKKIDPAIVGKKKMPDGSVRLIYEDLRIGPRHAEMLRPFNHDTVLSRWFNAPRQLWAEALSGKTRLSGIGAIDAAIARSALTLQILQRVSPLRRTNLARLRIAGPHPHIHLPVGDGEGRLYLPAIEMKNLRAVEVRIDPETVDMIRKFVHLFRPIALSRDAVSPANEHLFPGGARQRKELGSGGEYPEGFGYHSPDALSQTYSKHMRNKCALNVDMHVARHIAAKIILDIDPSAMGLVQEILEHKRIETTRAYYAEVSKLIAQKRYLQLLDRATRRALGTFDFRVHFEKQLGTDA